MNVPFDSIQKSVSGFTCGAIGGMDLGVSKMHRHFLKRPRFAASVHPQRHRGASSQSREQQFVGSRSRIRAADGKRLVGNYAVTAGVNFLGESGSAASDNHTCYVTFFHFVALDFVDLIIQE
jgi:hypothetical protein